MAESSSSPPHSPPDIFDGLSPPSQPENKWPTLSPASTIQPAQRVPSLPASWKEKLTQKSQVDYTKCREKYEKYFEGNRIHPIPELIKEFQPKTISFIITEVRTRRLAGIKKDTFEELLRAANIPAKYYCRRSFATWDVLMPSEEQAAKLAGEISLLNISGCSLSTWGGVESKSPCAMSPLLLMKRSWRPT